MECDRAGRSQRAVTGLLEFVRSGLTPAIAHEERFEFFDDLLAERFGLEHDGLAAEAEDPALDLLGAGHPELGDQAAVALAGELLAVMPRFLLDEPGNCRRELDLHREVLLAVIDA